MQWGEAWDTVKGWGSYVWNHVSVGYVVTGTVSYVYNTFAYLAQQLIVLPKVVPSLTYHQPTRQVARHLMWNFLTDLVPLATVTYGNYYLQATANDYLQNNEEEPLPFYAQVFIWTGSSLISIAAWTFINVRAYSKESIRSNVISIVAPRLLTSVRTQGYSLCLESPQSRLQENTLYIEQKKGRMFYSVLTPDGEEVRRAPIHGIPVPHPFTLDVLNTMKHQILSKTYKAGHTRNLVPTTPCTDHCSFMRFLNGALRDTLEYVATKKSIELVQYIPRYGADLARILSILHNGGAVMRATLSNLCLDHQKIYLEQYHELALAQGIMHFMLTMMTTNAIEYLTGLPPSDYEDALSQMFFICQIGFAAHMVLPDPVATSSRSIPDPVALYQRALGHIFDGLVWFVENKILPLFKPTEDGIDWQKWRSRGIQFWNHPLVKPVKYLALPSMLHGEGDQILGPAFYTDPVIAPHWNAVKHTAVSALDNFEEIRNWKMVKAARKAPGFSGFTLGPIFSLPSSGIRWILRFMNNRPWMQTLGSWKRGLLTMSTEPPLENVSAIKDGFELRETPAAGSSSFTLIQRTLPEPEGIIPLAPQRSDAVDAAKLIKPRKSAVHSPTMFQPAAPSSSSSPGPDEANPVMLLRKRKPLPPPRLFVPGDGSGQSDSQEPVSGPINLEHG